MKLKYMLRGIGIGAILMAAIMYFVYGKSERVLSDDEIKQKARELGMMTVTEFQNKELDLLKDKLPEISEIKQNEKTETVEVKDKSSDTSVNTKNTPSKEGGEAGKFENEGEKAGLSTGAEKNKIGKSENEQTETKLAGTENSKDENTAVNKTETTDLWNGVAKDEKSESWNTEKKNVTVKPETEVVSDKVNFSITAGMSSEKVAAALKTLGLIDDSTEFNKYLVKSGYADKIKIGSFELQQGQNYAEIADKLTK